MTEVSQGNVVLCEGVWMTISIRAATGEDAGAIAHVHVDSWRTTYAGIVPEAYLTSLDETLRAQLWREWLSGETLIFVAEWDGRIVGFAHGGPNREAASCDAELYSIYLLREAQKRGIGVALLQALATALVDRKFTSMAVWVLEANRSRYFYEKTGARFATTKVIDVGGAKLMEVSYVWADLKTISWGA